MKRSAPQVHIREAGTASPLSEEQADVRRLARAGVGVLIVYNLLLAGILLWRPCSVRVMDGISNLWQSAGPVFMVLWTLRGIQQARPDRAGGRMLPVGSERRWALGLLTLGLLLYSTGQAIWAYLGAVLRQEPFPPAVMVLWFASVPCFLFGALRLPSRPLPRAVRVRVVLDSLVLLASLLTFGWYYLIGPVVLNAHISSAQKWTAVASPVCELALAFCLIILVVRSDEVRLRPAILCFGSGLACILASETWLSYKSLYGVWQRATLLDLGWSVGFMLAGLGLRLAGRLFSTAPVAVPASREEDLQPDRMAPLWRQLMPYALVPLAFGVLVEATKTTGRADLRAGVLLCAAVLIWLVIVRQFVSIVENRRLYRQLHTTVTDLTDTNASLSAAYVELERKNQETTDFATNLAGLNEELQAMQHEVEANNQALAEANTRLAKLATTDAMTGLANHRSFHERLHIETSLAERSGHPLALLLLDVDHFKQYNDAYGHPAGDEVLRVVGQLLQQTVRAYDLPVRYGGEEFAVLMPNTSADGAQVLAERIRATIATYRFPHRVVTLSVGVADTTVTGHSGLELIAAADRALYSAKRNGRNQVVLEARFEEKAPLHECVEVGPVQITEGNWGSLEGLLQEPAGRTLCALLSLLDRRDARSEDHSQRLARFALRLAREVDDSQMGEMTPGTLRELAFGALLHDIGKIGLPDSLLHKEGPLTPDERDLVRRHPMQGAEMLAAFPSLAIALPVVQYHHERWDGAGYPHGLSGDRIPVSARIFAVVDLYEALSNERSGRGPLAHATICDEIERSAGTLFDPEVARAFLAIPEADWERLRRPDCAHILIEDLGAEIDAAA